MFGFGFLGCGQCVYGGGDGRIRGVRERWGVVLCAMLVCVMSGMPRSGWAALPINTTLGGAFTLPSTVPSVTGLPDFAGKVVLLNFGYTSCPDVCPMVLSRLSQLHKALEVSLGERSASVQTVFITVDPEYDTVARLRTYLDFFYPTMVGFSGTSEAVAQVAKQYGVVFQAEPSGEAEGRRVAHSDFVYLLDKKGRVRKLYSSEDSLDEMQTDITALLKEGEGWWARWF